MLPITVYPKFAFSNRIFVHKHFMQGDWVKFLVPNIPHNNVNIGGVCGFPGMPNTYDEEGLF